MPRYRVYLLSEARVTGYREQAPREAPIELRASHYKPSSEIEAPGLYEAWKLLQEAEVEERSYGVGDLLGEVDSDRLWVCHYWGFDEASWRDGQAPESAEPSNQLEAEENALAQAMS